MNESYYFFKIGVFCMFMIDNSLYIINYIGLCIYIIFLFFVYLYLLFILWKMLYNIFSFLLCVKIVREYIL